MAQVLVNIELRIFFLNELLNEVCVLCLGIVLVSVSGKNSVISLVKPGHMIISANETPLVPFKGGGGEELKVF